MYRWFRQHIRAIVFHASIIVMAASILFTAYYLFKGAPLEATTQLVVFLLGLIAFTITRFLPDIYRTRVIRNLLKAAAETVEYMSDGLNEESCQRVCTLVLPESKAIAIAMTDTEHVLAFAGEAKIDFPPGTAVNAPATCEVLKTGGVKEFEVSIPDNDKTFSDYVEIFFDEPKQQKRSDILPAGIVAALTVNGRHCGTIKFYYRTKKDITRDEMAIAEGIAQLLSTQLSIHESRKQQEELERQTALTAKAEVKALQAQINPHFLFNTLNTIAAFTRTNPDRAHTLMREFASFYRQTLENSQTLIPLAREMEQTRRYLLFEHARFGDERIVVSENIGPECENIAIPSFSIQPIVENAIRHAMKEEEPLHIDIQATIDEDNVLISITDNGVGMTEDVADKLRMTADAETKMSTASKGTGIALHNVAERLRHFYGEDAGIEITSKPGTGTCVTLILAHFACRVKKD